jgi:hypothetical protein
MNIKRVPVEVSEISFLGPDARVTLHKLSLLTYKVGHTHSLSFSYSTVSRRLEADVILQFESLMFRIGLKTVP